MRGRVFFVVKPKCSTREFFNVQWAAHGERSAVEYVGVDHRGADILVAEQLLDGADVATVFEQMGGE